MNIKALRDNILVKPYLVENNMGGLLVATENKYQNKGIVVASNLDNVKVGDIAIYSKYNYRDLILDGETYHYMKEDDVFYCE